MPIITLTTDFGTRDGFVGAMKGVIARRAPHATIVDIAHDIPRHDIAHAAWVVATTCRYFPTGTIHVVVVDPGVGTHRDAIMMYEHGSYYVGPDNGVFTYIRTRESITVRIADPRFMSDPVSATFHGRDVFAPAAAALSRGANMGDAGPAILPRGGLPWGDRQAGHGRIVHVDHYGNLISDLPAAEAGEAVRIVGITLPVNTTYASVPVGDLVAYVGSALTIEVAVREGRADERLGVERGAAIMPLTSVRSTTQGPYR